MPTIIRVKGYRLFFVSFDGTEPIHVHIRRGDLSAKVWLEPMRIAWSEFKDHEDRDILCIVEQHANLVREKWHEHFA